MFFFYRSSSSTNARQFPRRSRSMSASFTLSSSSAPPSTSSSDAVLLRSVSNSGKTSSCATRGGGRAACSRQTQPPAEGWSITSRQPQESAGGGVVLSERRVVGEATLEPDASTEEMDDARLEVRTSRGAWWLVLWRACVALWVLAVLTLLLFEGVGLLILSKKSCWVLFVAADFFGRVFLVRPPFAPRPPFFGIALTHCSGIICILKRSKKRRKLRTKERGFSSSKNLEEKKGKNNKRG